MESAVGDQNSKEAADQRQKNTFGEKLTQNAAAAGAESGADSNFAFARCGAREHQVCDVGASDEKDEANGGNQYKEARACTSVQLGLKAGDSRKVLLIDSWILLLELLENRFHLCLGLLDGNVRLQAAHHDNGMGFAVEISGIDRQRHPDVELAAGAEHRKITREHIDDCVRLLVEGNTLANDAGNAAEAA